MASTTLAPDLAATIAQAGVDLTFEGRTLQDAIRAAICDRGGYCSSVGLVWLMAPEIGIGPFLV